MMKGKNISGCFVLFCRATFRDEKFTSAKMFSASSQVNLELASLE